MYLTFAVNLALLSLSLVLVNHFFAAKPVAPTAATEATEATSPGEQDHTGGSAMGEGLQDSSCKAYIHGQIVPTE